MTRTIRTRSVMALSIARGGFGACELLAPALIARRVANGPVDTAARRVIRVLGARHIVQAAVDAVAPRTGVVEAGVVVDALHGASMVALGLTASDPVHRRLARADAVVAALFALGGRMALRRVRADGRSRPGAGS